MSFGGFNGEARAGMAFVSPPLHFSNGTPQRKRLLENADPGKPESESGILPERRLPETLKS